MKKTLRIILMGPEAFASEHPKVNLTSFKLFLNPSELFQDDRSPIVIQENISAMILRSLQCF